MGKRLSEMTLEELWLLFPIYLTAHQTCWKDWYAEEEAEIRNILTQAKQISHIGSTAVSTIWAKPIIDILVEVPSTCKLTDYMSLLTAHGYICMSQSQNRMSFNKGYTENGFAERVFHLHLRYIGDHDELYFRDYLIDHPDTAKAYEAMKLLLWKKHEHDRDAYTKEKTTFVYKYTQEAKRIYQNRY
ncbi:MAG: GrpB family protein [Ruminococcaceae bacterium]|nr:GrpB family protein [Oscillospiraceae bacterium]